MPPAPAISLYQSRLPAAEKQECGRAVFEVQCLTPVRVRILVSGDVDATNRQTLGQFVERHTRASQQLVLDLSAVDFFGSQGFTALYYVSVHCARRDVDWVIVGNRSVTRILGICDSEAELPVVADLDAAANKLDRCAKYRHSATLPNVRADDSSSTARTRRQPVLLQEQPSRIGRNAAGGTGAALVGGQKGRPQRRRTALNRSVQRSGFAERTELFERRN